MEESIKPLFKVGEEVYYINDSERKQYPCKIISSKYNDTIGLYTYEIETKDKQARIPHATYKVGDRN